MRFIILSQHKWSGGTIYLKRGKIRRTKLSRFLSLSRKFSHEFLAIARSVINTGGQCTAKVFRKKLHRAETANLSTSIILGPAGPLNYAIDYMIYAYA